VQLAEARSQLERRDDKIVELGRLVELSRDNDARHAASARDLRRQIADYQQQQQQQRINSASTTPPPAAVATADVPALYDRIRDLEDRIRSGRAYGRRSVVSVCVSVCLPALYNTTEYVTSRTESGRVAFTGSRHQSMKMRPVVTDVAWSLSVCVCLSVCRRSATEYVTSRTESGRVALTGDVAWSLSVCLSVCRRSTTEYVTSRTESGRVAFTGSRQSMLALLPTYGQFGSLSRPIARSKGKGSSITERRVPELIPVHGSQPAGDVSHQSGGSARPAVTLATLKGAATSFAAW